MTPFELLFEDPEMLDPDAREVPERLTRDELAAASDLGHRRDGWRFDDMEEDR